MKAPETLVLTSDSPQRTERFGAILASILPPGAVVALFGDLATGKTCLVRGMARALAGDEPIHSPTFTLVNQYGAPPVLYHLDLYRLSGEAELAELGYEELFDSDLCCVIEWAERAEGVLPAQRVDIHLSHAGGDKRQLELRNNGLLSDGWQDQLLEA